MSVHGMASDCEIRPLRTCDDPPIMTFSSALRLGNRPTPWRVLEMPILVSLCARIRCSGLPSKRTSPESGFRNPLITLKTVVLPAPLGPIKPVTVPRGTEMLTPSRICSPLKLTLMSVN
jgi:hypothetical protein